LKRGRETEVFTVCGGVGLERGYAPVCGWCFERRAVSASSFKR
jgi:hypothetical protein